MQLAAFVKKQQQNEQRRRNSAAAAAGTAQAVLQSTITATAVKAAQAAAARGKFVADVDRIATTTINEMVRCSHVVLTCASAPFCIGVHLSLN